MKQMLSAKELHLRASALDSANNLVAHNPDTTETPPPYILLNSRVSFSGDVEAIRRNSSQDSFEIDFPDSGGEIRGRVSSDMDTSSDYHSGDEVQLEEFILAGNGSDYDVMSLVRPEPTMYPSVILDDPWFVLEAREAYGIEIDNAYKAAQSILEHAYLYPFVMFPDSVPCTVTDFVDRCTITIKSVNFKLTPHYHRLYNANSRKGRRFRNHVERHRRRLGMGVYEFMHLAGIAKARVLVCVFRMNRVSHPQVTARVYPNVSYKNLFRFNSLDHDLNFGDVEGYQFYSSTPVLSRISVEGPSDDKEYRASKLTRDRSKDKNLKPRGNDVNYVLGQLNFKYKAFRTPFWMFIENTNAHGRLDWADKPFNLAVERILLDRRQKEELRVAVSLMRAKVKPEGLDYVTHMDEQREEMFKHYSRENRNAAEMAINAIRSVREKIHDTIGLKSAAFLYEILRFYMAGNWESRVLSIGAMIGMLDESVLIDSMVQVANFVEYCRKGVGQEELKEHMSKMKDTSNPMIFELEGESEEKEDIDDYPEYAENARLRVVPEGIQDAYEKFNAKFKKEKDFVFLTNQFIIKRIVEIWNKFLSTEMFSTSGDAFKEFCAKIGNGSYKAYVEVDFFASLLGYCATAIENIVAFSKSLDVNDLFGKSKNMLWFERYQKLCLDFDKFKHGGAKYERVYEDAIKLFADGMQLCSLPGANPISSHFAHVRYIMQSLEASCGKTRIQPVGLFIQGPPGCGKTTVIDDLTAMVQKYEKLPSSVNLLMYYNMSAKFQDGMTGNPKVIVFNDFFSTKEESMDAVVLDTLQMVTDIASFNVNRASLEGKTESDVYPDLVVLNSNTKKFFCKKSTNAEKLNRRYSCLLVSYTEAAEHEAKRRGIQVENLLENAGTSDGFVSFIYGTPTCRDSNIDLNINMELPHYTFNSWEEFLIFYTKEFTRIHTNYKHVYESKKTDMRCSFGLKLPHKLRGCPCEDVLEVPQEESIDIKAEGPTLVGIKESILQRMFFSILRVKEIFIEPKYFSYRLILFPVLWNYCNSYILLYVIFAFMWFTYDRDDWRVRSMVPLDIPSVICYYCLYLPWLYYDPFIFGFIVGVHYTVPSCYFQVYQTYLSIESKAVEQIANTYKLNMVVNFLYPHRKEIAIGSGVLVGLGLLILAIRMSKKIYAEGMVQGKPTNIEEVRLPVHPVRSMAPPGLSRNISPVAIVSRADGFTMRGTMVDSYRIIVPYHFIFDDLVPNAYVPPIHEGDVISVELNGRHFEFRFSKKTCVPLLRKGEKVDALLLYTQNAGWNCPGTLEFTDDNAYHQCVVRGKPIDVVYDNRPLYGITYGPIRLEAGDCGEGIFSNQFFLGHHGGRLSDDNHAVAVRITLSMFLEANDRLRVHGSVIPTFGKDVLPEGILEGLHPKSDAFWLEKQGLMPLYYVGHRKTKNTVKMTGRKSEMFSIFGSRCETYVRPNVGHAKRNNAGEWTSIAVRSFGGMGAIRKYDYNLMELLLNLWEYSPRIRPVGRISIHQTLVGDANNAYLNPRDDTKAIGIGLREKGVTKKTAVEVIDNEFYSVHAEVIKSVEEKEKILKTGTYRVRVEGVIKDEMITAEAYEKGKGRYFYVSCLVDNLELKSYFGNTLSVILADTGIHQCFAGINAAGPAWKKLADHITFDGTAMMVYEGDENRFDKRHGLLNVPYITILLKQASILGMDAQTLEEGKNLLFSGFHGEMDMEGNIYHLDSTLWSGKADTIHCNTIKHAILLKLAFLALAIQQGRHISKGLWKDLRLALVGDDVLWNSRVAEFTIDYVTSVLKDMGYVMTSPGLKNDVGTQLHITEATFLKRKFRFQGDRVFAPLAVESLYKSLSYVVGGPIERVRTLSLLTSIQYEWFLHGREALMAFHEDLDRVEELLNIRVGRVDYDGLLEAFDQDDLIVW